MNRTTFFVGLTCILAATVGCDPNPVECGEGTVEKDGECVVAGGTGDGGTADGADGADGADDDDEDDGGGKADGADGDSGDDEGPTFEPYGACPGMSDVECVDDIASGWEERCRPPVNGCTSSCFEDSDCLAPSSGTAVQRCEELYDDPGDGNFMWYSGCVLGCHADLVCPDGMTCGQVPVTIDGEDPTTIEACVWP